MLLLKRKVNGEVAFSCDTSRLDNKPLTSLITLPDPAHRPPFPPQPPLPRVKRNKIPRHLWEEYNARELGNIDRYFDEFASRLPTIVFNKEKMKEDLFEFLYDTFDHTRKLSRDMPPHD